MNALCYASGLIVFSRGRAKPGALPIAAAPARTLRRVVSAVARLGYKGELLVPGLPEACDWEQRSAALVRFTAEIQKRLGKPALAKRIEKYEARQALKRRVA